MSTSLAVKYRPTTFDDVVEQNSVKTILLNQLETNTIQHAYLFVGSAGCGKTTSARIFANEINKGQGTPIEIDAASHNGVDDVRMIIDDSKTQSIDSEYKIYIFDECFSSNMMVSLDVGYKPISEVVIGDIVKSMYGNHTVTNVFKNSVLTDRLCCVSVNGKKIITTVDHLFFTNIGWVKAGELHEGDIVYADTNLHELWQRVSNTPNTQEREILLSSVFSAVPKEDLHSKNQDSLLSDLRSADGGAPIFQEEDVFKKLYEHSDFEVRKSNDEYRVRYGVTETVFRKNEIKQSHEFRDCQKENVTNENHKQYSSCVVRSQGWEREVYYSPDSLVADLREWLGIRVSSTCDINTELARLGISLELQSRPWLTRETTSDRGGWQRSSVEKFTITGCQENSMSEEFRVDSVEVYQRGYNDELFRGSFTDTELSSKYVTMYDLEVDGAHNYFVNGILVHNCHMLSTAAWNAMLKMLEEPPAKSIYILCTTNPEKIPQTILSRVQRYDFQKISTEGIYNRLTDIIKMENGEQGYTYDAEPDALSYIAKLSNGGMRTAISLMDKCFSYSTKLTVENVVNALGVADYADYIQLAQAMLISDAKSAIEVIEEVKSSGKDIKQFVKGYLEFCLDVCKYCACRDFKYIKIPNTPDYKTLLDKWIGCGALFKRYVGVLISLNSDLRWETDPFTLVEATIYLECGT